jgi:hypothetical protein
VGLRSHLPRAVKDYPPMTADHAPVPPPKHPKHVR